MPKTIDDTPAPLGRPLRVTYDPEADAAYVYFTRIEPGGVARTVPTTDGAVMLDFDLSGRLLGVEVIGARGRLPPDLLAIAVLPGTE